jgi:L-threonylcarbamoyladenylate synthase
LAKPFIDIQQQIEQGISILRKGGLVAYPTDTVYGLGAAMNLPVAVERIYSVKGRSLHSPLPLLLADVSQIADVADSVPASARCFLRNFFPGALTLVLPKSRAVPSSVTGGGDTVAVRVPDHPVPVALIKGLGVPIVGTSANLSGQPSSLTAGEVATQLGKTIDLIIDGGRCPGGKESTIVDVTGEIPVILREGAVSREELEWVCGHIEVKIYPERSRREESK